MGIQGCRRNREIRGVSEVRLISEYGEQMGVMSYFDALRHADGLGLDLIEVSPKAEPPVCKIGDYNKLVYQENKHQKEHAKAGVVTVKEVQFRPSIGDHDLDVKMKNVIRFLEEGDRVKLVIVFRGREITHREIGMALLDRLIEKVKGVGVVDQMPAQEGKRVFVVLRRAAVKDVTRKEKIGVAA